MTVPGRSERMEIQYKDKTTQTLLRKESVFCKDPKHTLDLWKDLKTCMSVLAASKNMQKFIDRASQLKRKRKPSFRPKPLKKELAGQISIRLNKEARLIFEPLNPTDIYREGKSVDWEKITGIRILEILPDHDFDGTKRR